MINCFVFGDIRIIELLRRYINDCLFTTFVGYSVRIPENTETINTHRRDIIFVDTSLLSENDLWLEEIKLSSSIILISGCVEEAFAAFEHAAFDYLVKPVSFNRFMKSINKFSHLAKLAQSVYEPFKQEVVDSFFIKADSKGFKEVLIKCDQLLYIQALQNYVVLHMENNLRFSCHNSMKEMEDSLSGSAFSRIHKSYIINEQKITSIEGNVVILNNNENHRLLIGNTYRKAFFEKKNQRMIKKRSNLPVVVYTQIAGSLCFLGLLIEEFLEASTFILFQ
ncbi:LytTR family DNA-binding domain-containing protein [Pedobacter sp. AJM]|uniref:LytR/AlgR family response regulator transcription factor n=1 Tax=Pedobacter sp. AJM TaxID=2003629 RepID=UPI000B4BD7A7|nr:response regulator transcription factor [Pedobacter sp. AJM]OWK68856.1 hypothetical protein CBW18_19795 [Pedobacter sp. AJM]